MLFCMYWHRIFNIKKCLEKNHIYKLSLQEKVTLRDQIFGACEIGTFASRLQLFGENSLLNAKESQYDVQEYAYVDAFLVGGANSS